EPRGPLLRPCLRECGLWPSSPPAGGAAHLALLPARCPLAGPWLPPSVRITLRGQARGFRVPGG
ncbi:hypothetical protein ABTP21_17590, partial [Acinetobacter baumannii]